MIQLTTNAPRKRDFITRELRGRFSPDIPNDKVEVVLGSLAANEACLIRLIVNASGVETLFLCLSAEDYREPALSDCRVAAHFVVLRRQIKSSFPETATFIQ